MNVPTIVQESCVYQLWLLLVSQYEASRLHAFLVAAGKWCNRQLEESWIVSFFLRDGVLSKAWPESITCHVLCFLAGLPARFLQWLYSKFQKAFDESFFANLAFQAGRETAAMEFWVILLLWIIPFAHWANGYSLLAFAFLFLLLHAGAMAHKDIRLDMKRLGIYPVLMFGGVFLGTLLSFSPSLSFRFFLYHAAAALCVVVTVSAVRRLYDLKRLLAGATCVTLVISVYGIIQRIQGVEVNRSYVDLDLSLNENMPGRVQSIFDNPNTFAEVLVMLVPLAIALMLCSHHPVAKGICLVAALTGVLALAMTYSRACYLGIAAAAAVFVFLWRPRLIPAFIGIVLVAIPLMPSSILNRILTITNLNDASTNSRFPMWQAALRVILRDPFAGAGLGIDATQAYVKTNQLYTGHAPFVHAHNMFLEIYLETGLTGFVGFLGSALWSIKRAAIAAKKCKDSLPRTAACAAAAALCGTMVAGMADFPWHYPRVLVIYWFVFAVAVSAVKLCLQPSGEPLELVEDEEVEAA